MREDPTLTLTPPHLLQPLPRYLLNLDVNSAHYDPKSRSMREDPTPNKPMNEKTFAGDNFVRKGGDFAAWQSMQLHSMQAFDKGQDVHLQANPSLAEMLYKQFKDKKEQLGKQVCGGGRVRGRGRGCCTSSLRMRRSSLEGVGRNTLEMLSRHSQDSRSSWREGRSCSCLCYPPPPAHKPPLPPCPRPFFCAAQGAKEVEDKYGNAAEKMPEDVAQLAATERWVERAGVTEEWLFGGRKAELLGSQGRFGCRRRFGH